MRESITTIARWGRDPIVVPRWMLTVKYVGFVVLGAVSARAGAPSLERTTWDGYVAGWSMLLVAASLAAAIGSTRHKWEALEKWSGLCVASLMTAYAASAVYLALTDGPEAFLRWAFAVVLTMVTMLPWVRAVSLLRRTGSVRSHA